MPPNPAVLLRFLKAELSRFLGFLVQLLGPLVLSSDKHPFTVIMRPISSRVVLSLLVLSFSVGRIPVFAQSSNGPVTGLVGYWSFDEGAGTTANDSSGNGNTGSINAATWTAGEIGEALSFSRSSSSRVIVPDAPSLRLSGSWTVSLWFNMNSLPSDYYGLCVKTGTIGTNYSMMVDNTGAPAAYFDDGVRIAQVSGSAMKLGVWYHLVGVWDSSTQILSLYVNGTLVNSARENINADSGSGTALGIGVDTSGGNINTLIGYSNGIIDDVRVFNRALSASALNSF